ncbi:MAG: glycoside hydrolase family 16 protein [Acidimicrobiales bacterium]|nr:glycoside hydrolase family 16 protein [Acidimicrobiales bacterium]
MSARPLRAISLGCAAWALTLGLLTACGDSSPTETGADETPPPESTTTTTRPPAEAIVFEDDFDGDGPLDPAVWRPMVEVRHEASLTDSPDNLYRADGNLVIEARAEASRGARFTSGFVQTRASFQYGRYEARMKLPTGAGTWPAFWLYGDDWPDQGEIDVMEHYGINSDSWPRFGLVYSNLHSTPPEGQPGNTSRDRLVGSPADPEEWHTYAVEWEPDEIRFYVDNQQTALHTRPDPDPDNAWPFDDYPEVIAFDLFLGAYAGEVDASAMPQRLLVDWVRVTRLPGVETVVVTP